MMSKSANYCYSGLSQGTGLLLLAEVAVAPFHDLIHANYDAHAECKAKNKLYVTSSFHLTLQSSFRFILPLDLKCHHAVDGIDALVLLVCCDVLEQPKVSGACNPWVGVIVPTS